MFRLMSLSLLLLALLLVGCSSTPSFSEEAQSAFAAQLAAEGLTEFEIVSAEWVDNPVEMQADYFCVQISTIAPGGFNGFRVIDDAPEYQITHRFVVGDPSQASGVGTGIDDCFQEE